MLIAEELNLSSSDLVIDVGCGRAYFAVAIVKLANVIAST